MAVHLLIVDALNLIRRIHAVQNSPCLNACQHALGQLIHHSQPTHAVAVFDDEPRTYSWRHQLLAEYKEGRTPMPDTLAQELPRIKEAFLAMGVNSWHSPGNEADDLAATLACKVSAQGHQATIVSTDKGYCQLLAPAIRIRDYFQKRWLDAPFVSKEFGVQPKQLPDYWGLVGISSSKIPGVNGIGPKTAAQLLQQADSLEQLYQQLDQVPEKWRHKLLSHQEIAYRSREVATLKTDLHFNGNLQQLRLPPAMHATPPSY
ncbi:flap endonuclease Xni [Dickeya lacustris]|uniref:Flap endonuclease Xni n=1 Tax=Dickeya lacustris TaxID=2259638 RepID=A0ABY8G5L1_9GAMM|nr:flap endonuclease Xni [Dickeya lacustris]WFN55235.1 flap endonuclease Xni [Dickeya lacustris]